jgi:hypothetical protein
MKTLRDAHRRRCTPQAGFANFPDMRQSIGAAPGGCLPRGSTAGSAGPVVWGDAGR